MTPGLYRLVSESIYGTPEPDYVATPLVGEQVVALLDVCGDKYEEVFGGWDRGNGEPQPQVGTGGQLVDHQTSLVALAGFVPDAGAPWQAAPYTATPTTLTLITLYAYNDQGAGMTLGSYTVVAEFALPSAVIDASPAVAPTGGDPSSRPPSSARDPRCPMEAPSDGEACNPTPAPLGCEYGGDPYGRCTTYAACALQTDGAFRFDVSRSSDCAPNVAACPDSFATGMRLQDAGGPCPEAYACNYPEGVCGCGSESCASAWTCRARGGADGSNEDAGVCPAKRPLAGDGCASEGATCGYDSPCSPHLSLGPMLICQNGYWEEFVGFVGITGCTNREVGPCR